MTEAFFFQVASLIIVVAANTAIFIWRLVSFRDDIVAKLDHSKQTIDNKIDIVRQATELHLDGIRRDLNDFKVHVASEYLDKDSVNAHLDRLQNTMTTGLEKLEARFIRLDERLARAARVTDED